MSKAVGGYVFTEKDGLLCVEPDPAVVNPSWKAMLDFAARFPRGDEPEWVRFIDRNTRQQTAEREAATREYWRTKGTR